MKSLFTTFIRRTMAAGLLSAVLGAAGALPARAEGSKNLTPGTSGSTNAKVANDFIGYLQHNDADNSNLFLSPNATATERLYVRMQSGDTLFYAVHRINSSQANDRLRLRVMDASGALKSDILSLATGTNPNNALLAAQAGVVDNYAQAQVGPRYRVAAATPTPAAGYNPLYYVNTGVARDVWVEFAQINNAGTVIYLPNGNNQTGKSWYDIWDFTVRNRGEKSGRLYANTWSFTGGAFDAQYSTSFNLYPLIPNPNAVTVGTTKYASNESFFIKRVSYARMTPFGVLLVANEFGTTSAAGRTTFQQRRRSIDSNVGYAQYKMFVNNPDESVYPTTAQPNKPTVTTSCNSTTKVTTFTLNVDQAGFGVVFIDGNQDDKYQAASDRILEGTTQVGDNTFTWDGKSDNGTTITSNKINISFSSGVGPVNFPLFDCESANFAGITVRSIRPGGLLAPDFVYWDDTNLAAGFSSPAYNPNGTSDQANGHRWGIPGNNSGPPTGGNQVLVNTYAVGLLARGQAVDIVYNPNDACATVVPPIVLPVKLTRFEARAESNSVRLNWETASEVNSAYFEVERSLNGQQFAPIGRVAAQGISNGSSVYSLQDVNPPAAPVLYYRLHQTDLDGTSAYSGVRLVQPAARALKATVYPNPVVGALSVRLYEPLTGPVTIRILDATGRLMWQQHRQLAAAQQELEVSVEALPAGRNYILQLQTSSSSIIQHFVK